MDKTIIVGGPRTGKSTQARQLRREGTPTFCTDPASRVDEPEEGVTYLPEGLDWSEASAYVAEQWLTMPGPWCIEGVATARAIRKLQKTKGTVCLDGVRVLLMFEPAPGVELLKGQASMAKGVETVWKGIATSFPLALRV